MGVTWSSACGVWDGSGVGRSLGGGAVLRVEVVVFFVVCGVWWFRDGGLVGGRGIFEHPQKHRYKSSS
jgi:hypothetical protein